MTTHLDGKELEKQLVSEDKTTILTRIPVDKNQGEIDQVSKALDKF
ncbi:hypothetical protein [Paenibacillus etheri]|nr:hypothetical protein [Paenibacillus etheri]